MPKPHLPNEIILQIASYFIPPKHPAKVNPNPSQLYNASRMLWTLSRTCRMLRDFARRHIYETVCLNLTKTDPLHKDANILTLPDVAQHIRCLKLWSYDENTEGPLAERDEFGFKDVRRKYFLSKKFGGHKGVTSSLNYRDVNNTCWAAESAIHISRILQSGSATLRSIELIDANYNNEFTYAFFTMIARIFSVYRFPEFRRILFSTNSIGLASAFWDTISSKLTGAEMLKRNINQLEEVVIHTDAYPNEERSGWVPYHHRDDIRRVQEWLAKLPSLRTLRVFTVRPERPHSNTLFSLAGVKNIHQLRELELDDVEVLGSLSEALTWLMNLEYLKLKSVTLAHAEDRWQNVFDVCGDMLSLKTLDISATLYDDVDEKPGELHGCVLENIAFTRMQEKFEQRGVRWLGDDIVGAICEAHENYPQGVVGEPEDDSPEALDS